MSGRRGRRSFHAIVLGGVAALAMSGCVLTTDYIDLEYVPQPGVGPVRGAEIVEVDVKVVDNRPDKSRVSCKKDGFGKEAAPIIANEDVAVTVRKAMEQELRARGFTIRENAPVVVQGDLQRFYNDHKVGIFSGDDMADLNMRVLVKDRTDRIVYSRQIAGWAALRTFTLMSGETARVALNNALKHGMVQLFSDHLFITKIIEAALK